MKPSMTLTKCSLLYSEADSNRDRYQLHHRVETRRVDWVVSDRARGRTSIIVGR